MREGIGSGYGHRWDCEGVKGGGREGDRMGRAFTDVRETIDCIWTVVITFYTYNVTSEVEPGMYSS